MRPARLAFVLATLGLIAGLLTPRTARADADPQVETEKVEIETWVLKDTVDPDAPDFQETDTDNYREITDTIEEDEFFNLARCTCSGRNKIMFRLVPRGLTNADYKGNTEFWTGDNTCGDNANTANRDVVCERHLIFDTNDLRGEFFIFLEADALIDPKNNKSCSVEGTSTAWVLIDSDTSTATYEFPSSKLYDIDTQPPPQVLEYEGTGAEAQVVLTWEVPEGAEDDIELYQVICSYEGQPIRTDPPKPEFEEGCGVSTTPMPDGGMPDAGTVDAGADASVDAGPDAAPLPPIDAAVDAAPAADASLAQQDAAPGMTGPLDPRYICATVAKGSNEARIDVPEDLDFSGSKNVKAELVAIDRHGNATRMGVKSVVPAPVQDFWEVYEDQGGSAEGGFCFVATAAYGDYDHPSVLVLRDFRDKTLAHSAAGRAFTGWYYRNSPALAEFIREHAAARLAARVLLWPVVIVAGTWEYTTALDKLALLALLGFAIVRRRRRKLARAQAPRVVSEPSPRARRAFAAAATTILVLLCTAHVASAQAVYDDELDESLGPPRSQWIFELKFGPYLPAIDEEISATPGPYEKTFGDKNSFMTQLELDRYFLYPAGQLGVAFGLGYMQNTAAAFVQKADGTPDYTMRAPADDTAFHLLPVFVGVAYRFTMIADETVIPVVPYAKLGVSYYLWWITKGNGDLSSTMDKGKARGGTLGWQGSLGLSLRADEIDPSAARSLQTELGVEHAGFFAEVTYADVDGLGMKRKLHVGDFTWFAGVNFEF